MNGAVLSTISALVAASAALANWWAAAVGRRAVEVVAKPLTMVGLVGAVLALGAGDHPPGRWLLAALLLCLIGDVALLGDSSARFLGGLTAFLLGHVAYVLTFVSIGHPWQVGWVTVGALTVVVSLVAGRAILPSVLRSDGPALAVPVAAYMLVIGAMAVTGWGTGLLLVGLGVSLFVVSDTMLAIDRFVAPRPRGHLVVMVTYHLAQALIVLGVLAGMGELG